MGATCRGHIKESCKNSTLNRAVGALLATFLRFGAEPVADGFEHRGVERAFEFDTDDPAVDPADIGLDRFEPRQADPDDVVERHFDRRLDAAAERRKIEQLDAIAMVTWPTKIDFDFDRDALRAALDAVCWH